MFRIHCNNKILIFAGIVLTACKTNKIPANLEESFKVAGKNKSELIKVINHYSRNSKDSLKLKAAFYLIENMYVRYSNNSDFFKVTIKELSNLKTYNEKSTKIKSLIKIYQNDFNKIIYDCQIIKAEYLISNIELAFKVWKEQPWGKYISFNIFCEYILPYKIGNEPIENWRRSAYELFNPLLDSVRLKGGSVLEAAKVINDHLIKKGFIWTSITQEIPFNMGFEFLNKVQIGYCRESSDYVTYIMRALGIPAGEDFVVQMANTGKSHTWNFILDSDERIRAFDGTWTNIDAPFIHKKSSKKGKVFRNMYRIEKNAELLKITQTEKIPRFFMNTNIHDVSAYYFKHNIISVPCLNPKNKIAYLCVFNNMNWTPISWGKNVNNNFVFHDLENKVAYLPCYYENEELVPFYYPIILDDSINIKEMIPVLKTKQNLTLYRKFHVGENLETYKNRIIHGKFQGALNSNFKDAKDLCEIVKIPEFLFGVVKPKTVNKFRFVRYISPKNGNCNIAEIIFFSGTNKPITGEIIGTECTWGNSKENTMDKVFDGNVLTFYDSCLADSGWVGLDLKEPKVISKIVYAPRNDDNYVKKGDLYELFYHDGKEWVSLGRKQSDTFFLKYSNAPMNALFLLHDHSGGVEERIFTYENGEQVWW
jgi:hypothetical protein